MLVDRSEVENSDNSQLNFYDLEDKLAVRISDNISNIINDHAVEHHVVELSAKDFRKKARYFYLFPTNISLHSHRFVRYLVELLSLACVFLFTFPKLLVDALDVL